MNTINFEDLRNRDIVVFTDDRYEDGGTFIGDVMTGNAISPYDLYDRKSESIVIRVWATKHSHEWRRLHKHKDFEHLTFYKIGELDRHEAYAIASPAVYAAMMFLVKEIVK